jgi:magnesium-transporting ATPase (P-type)
LSQEEGDDGNFLWKPKGNSSEAPIIVAAGKVMMTVNALQKPALENLPLAKDAKHLVCVKSAPNFIMEVCTQYLAADGSVQPLTQALKDTHMAKVDELSEQALRVLAMAYRTFPRPALRRERRRPNPR